MGVSPLVGHTLKASTTMQRMSQKVGQLAATVIHHGLA